MKMTEVQARALPGELLPRVAKLDWSYRLKIQGPGTKATIEADCNEQVGIKLALGGESADPLEVEFRAAATAYLEAVSRYREGLDARRIAADLIHAGAAR